MLDLDRIDNLRRRGSKATGACPACRAEGRDKKGIHFFCNTETERFGCAAHQGDKAHRQAIFSYIGIVTDPTDEDKEEWKKRKRHENDCEVIRLLEAAQNRTAKANAPAALNKRLAPYLEDDWYLEFLDQSPIRFRDNESLRHEFLLRLFYSDDILWLGKDRYQSGKPHHAANFRTRDEWLKDDELPQRICSGTFDEGCISRAKEFVDLSPYIVIECDEIIGKEPKTDAEKAENKKLNAALIRYAQDRLGLTLRAVIDTGNKSLHGWFDHPSQHNFEALCENAELLGIDPSVLKTSPVCAVMLPGCIHEKSNKPATLIYLNPITI
jgi:hypothetical protein